MTDYIRGSLRLSLQAAGRAADTVTLGIWQHGGQGTARRNAWAAMVDNSRRSRERAEVEASLAATSGVAAPAVAISS